MGAAQWILRVADAGCLQGHGNTLPFTLFIHWGDVVVFVFYKFLGHPRVSSMGSVAVARMWLACRLLERSGWGWGLLQKGMRA